MFQTRMNPRSDINPVLTRVHKMSFSLFAINLFIAVQTMNKRKNIQWIFLTELGAFIGVETAALIFRTKQYSTSYSSHICYGKRFYNDFFLNHHTIALVNNCLKLLSCVVIETALDLMKKNQLS